MHFAVVVSAPNTRLRWRGAIRDTLPTFAQFSLAIGSALLLVLSFPDFDVSWLAWIGLVPLIVAIASANSARQGLLIGWFWGIVFFYGTCWWLTYPMIHYAPLASGQHIPTPFAYLLLLIPVMFVALFPALCCLLLVRVNKRFGSPAILTAPLIWISIEWLRYVVTGQVWNAIGYSQAFHPLLIQSARVGGVYAVGFLLFMMNVAVAFMLMRKFRDAACAFALTIVFVVVLSYGSHPFPPIKPNAKVETIAIAIQPNVPMNLNGDTREANDLLQRHLTLTQTALNDLDSGKPNTFSTKGRSRLMIWPESPMNFSYTRDPHLQDVVGNFARTSRASVLLNSLEPGVNGTEHNSAVLVNEQGQKIAQYDKIRLMPFGEYVPLPRWLPGASSVRGIVGEFTPGSSYTLMPLGANRAGVFICIEAAHPGIARAFANEGADLLINISNDGYLGPTPVMRQHLANAVFRAVENDRPLVRVTNSGITASIDANGTVWDETHGFEQAVRTWSITENNRGTTFYTRHGDVFVYGCGLISLACVAASFTKRKIVQ